MKILYAIKNDNLVFISEVENGLKCNCFCAACGEQLVAKNGGKKKIHHFAHYSGADCAHGYETSIHLLAKKILMESKWIQVPELILAYDNSSFKLLLMKSEHFIFDNVESEVGFESIIPDLTCYADSIIKLFIEIKVTHGIDEIKYSKLKSYNIPTLEIDLSNIDREIDETTLKEILHIELSHKNWILHNLSLEYHGKINSITIPKQPIERGFALHYDDCPINARTYKGRSYANVIDDCLECSQFVSSTEEGIRCLGKYFVGTIDDIDNLYAEYKRNPILFMKENTVDETYDLGELWKKNGNKPFRAINIKTKTFVEIGADPYLQWEKYYGKCYGKRWHNGKYCGSEEIYYSKDRDWKMKD